MAGTAVPGALRAVLYRVRNRPAGVGADQQPANRRGWLGPGKLHADLKLEVLPASHPVQPEISFYSSIFGIIIATLGSYSLRRVDSPLRNFVTAFANMTSNFAGVPLAFAFIILLGFNGSITIMLKQAGIIQDFNLYSKTGLIILYTYFQIPLGVLLLYPAFDALREDWRESASLLGANGWQFWRHIGLPVLTPALLGTFVILLANALGAYATVYALTTGNFNVLPIRIAGWCPAMCPSTRTWPAPWPWCWWR